MRIGKLILAFILSIMVGCFPLGNAQTVKGSVHLEHIAKEPDPSEYNVKVTPVVFTLLGLAGVSFLMTVMAASVEDPEGSYPFTLATATTGVVFLSSAGIVYLLEE